jgi:hypothetical protein
MVSWWRGLPARAWTTGFRRDGRAEGRMPTAPWEASSGVRRISGTATGGPESPAAGSGSGTATASSPGPATVSGLRPWPPVTGSVTDRTDTEHDVSRGSGRVRDSGRDSGSGQRRGPVRSRNPGTAPGHGVGHGPNRCGALGTPGHRPAVACGSAFAPARPPQSRCS